MKQLTDKDAAKIGKAINKLIGANTKFILVIKDDEQSTLANISNTADRYEIIGMLEMTKNDFLTPKLTPKQLDIVGNTEKK